MANTLKIIKKGTNKFWHIHNGIDATKFAISTFSASIDGNKFNIIQNDGAVRFTYLIENITIQDESTGGSNENYTSPIIFWNRLIALRYTPFYTIPVNGLTTDELDAIQNANLPSGSNPFATFADLNGSGGATPQNLQTVTDGAGNNETTNPIIVEELTIKNIDGLTTTFRTPNSDAGWEVVNDLGYVTLRFPATENVIDIFDQFGADNNLRLDYSQITGQKTATFPNKDIFVAGLDDIIAAVGDYLKKDGSNANSNVDLGVYLLICQRLKLRNLSGKIGTFRIDDLTSDRSIRFGDKDYDRVADITDVTAAISTANTYADNAVNNASLGLLKDVGNFNASLTGSFPTAPNPIKQGYTWTVSVDGAINGIDVTVGDVVRALVDNPGQIASNWVITENNIGYVPENKDNKVSSITGNEQNNSLYASLVAILNYFSASKIRSILGVTTLLGSNTGDETSTTIKSKLGITTLSGSNTGDQDLSGFVLKNTTVNSKALSTNITLNTDDIAESGTPTNKWWTNSRTIASTLTNFTSGVGTVSASDTILQAIQKIVGNINALVTGVSSVNTKTGAVTLTTADIADSTGKRYQSENQNTYNDDATSSIQTQLDSKQKLPSFMRLVSAYTGTSSTALQKMFNVGSSGNGSFSTGTNKTYKFRVITTLSGLSAVTGTHSFGFLGTANISNIKYVSTSSRSSNNATISAPSSLVITTATASALSVTNVVSTARIQIEGIISITTAGTLIPSFAVSSSTTPIVDANSYFEILEIGTDTVTTTNDIS